MALGSGHGTSTVLRLAILSSILEARAFSTSSSSPCFLQNKAAIVVGGSCSDI